MNLENGKIRINRPPRKKLELREDLKAHLTKQVPDPENPGRIIADKTSESVEDLGLAG